MFVIFIWTRNIQETSVPKNKHLEIPLLSTGSNSHFQTLANSDPVSGKDLEAESVMVMNWCLNMHQGSKKYKAVKVWASTNIMVRKHIIQKEPSLT